MKKPQLEKPFEYLTRKDGSNFPAETVKNWYISRAYILDKLNDTLIGIDSDSHLHAVVMGDSPLMLSVVRQLALYAHFANYEETDVYGNPSHRNRTVVTIVSNRNDIIQALHAEEYLCNLIDHCKYTIDGQVTNSDSFIDIELEIVRDWQPSSTPDTITITEKEVISYANTCEAEKIFSIDTRKAVLSSRIYNLGVTIENLPAENIHSTHRYGMAMDSFKYNLLGKTIMPLVDESTWLNNPLKVKGDISNIFCSDTFEARYRTMIQYCGKNYQHSEHWDDCIEALSKCEHSRWIAERLIMGYRTPTNAELIRDERTFGDLKKTYRNSLKNNAEDPTHICLCSYAELRRISPDGLKYDSFMILAIPVILGKLNKIRNQNIK